MTAPTVVPSKLKTWIALAGSVLSFVVPLIVSVEDYLPAPWPAVIGGVIVGVMARYGSAAIRGHGIPEAMEAVLINRSRIQPRVAILKPISAAIAIGTGGPEEVRQRIGRGHGPLQ